MHVWVVILRGRHQGQEESIVKIGICLTLYLKNCTFFCFCFLFFGMKHEIVSGYISIDSGVSKMSFEYIVRTDAGRGVPEVVILDPSGHKNTVPVKVRPISQDVWRCEYVSPVVGLHSVNVFFAGQPIPNSPYGVRVAPGMLLSL